jgi:endo-1,4-beta-xylanase
MKNKLKITWLAAVTGTILFWSCSKKENPHPTTTTITTTDTSTLKGSAGFYLGFAINNTLMTNGSAFAATAQHEANAVTFDYAMKHGAIVQNDGTLNFTGADALYNICTAAGLQVYGHNLCWYTNQNATYLNSLTAGTTASTTNLIQNGSFESGISTNWFTQVSATAPTAAAFSVDNTTFEDGVQSMKVVVTTPGPNSYSIQAVNDAYTGVAGSTYKVSFYAKGAGSVKLVMQGAVYDGDMTFTTTANWAQYTWAVTLIAGETAPQVRFNFPVAGTYNIDNVTVNSTAPVALTQAQIAANIDGALNSYVTGMCTHYAGKVKAWDVVNEPMTDGNGDLRTNLNTFNNKGATDFFLWSQYLGRNYALKAFQYAKAADPNALLFINEYNLESNNSKLDSLLGYVKELQNKGAHIDGIGTQMHISINTPLAGIDNAFVKLAATGLKIRVSELDVRINPGNTPGFAPTGALLGQQSTMYNYVISSYKKNVPAAQQYGITIWGIDDPDSWIIISQKDVDAPLLFDAGFAKKPAYTGALQALKSK